MLNLKNPMKSRFFKVFYTYILLNKFKFEINKLCQKYLKKIYLCPSTFSKVISFIYTSSISNIILAQYYLY